jgi:hypothetical protein
MATQFPKRKLSSILLLLIYTMIRRSPLLDWKSPLDGLQDTMSAMGVLVLR